MIIGTFRKDGDGFVGALATLTHHAPLTFTPAAGADYAVMSDGTEVGAAWKRTGRETGKPYLSVKLDSPFLPGPVNCALLARDGGVYVLVWNRDERKSEPRPAVRRGPNPEP
jgi:uncharacterized protein (DUF736 family)